MTADTATSSGAVEVTTTVVTADGTTATHTETVVPDAPFTTDVTKDEEVRFTEEWVEQDGRQFYTVTFDPIQHPLVATLTVVHGLGEHIRRYDDMMRTFARAGIRVHGYDQRGFGRTGQRGGILGDNEGFDTVQHDIAAAIKRTRVEGVPAFLFGHSMGGMNVLNYGALHASKDVLRGIISSGPAIAVHKSSRPNILVTKLLTGVELLAPTMAIANNLDTHRLSHDPKVAEELDASEYNIAYMTLRTAKSVLANGDALLKVRYGTFKTPLFLTHGTGDVMTCPKGSQKFFDKLSKDLDKTLVLVHDHYHEIHLELGKELIIHQMRDWILARAK